MQQFPDATGKQCAYLRVLPDHLEIKGLLGTAVYKAMVKLRWDIEDHSPGYYTLGTRESGTKPWVTRSMTPPAKIVNTWYLL